MMCVMAPYKKQGTVWGAAWSKKQRLGSTREHCCEREEQASQVVLEVTNPPANAGDMKDMGSIPRLGRSLEKGTATHSSILAWRMPWTEEPGGLQSMGL